MTGTIAFVVTVSNPVAETPRSAWRATYVEERDGFGSSTVTTKWLLRKVAWPFTTIGGAPPGVTAKVTVEPGWALRSPLMISEGTFWAGVVVASGLTRRLLNVAGVLPGAGIESPPAMLALPSIEPAPMNKPPAPTLTPPPSDPFSASVP